MRTRRRPELLAPAGDMEKLQMAVAYGADAVYLAGTSFGMRSFAGNFTPEELPKAVALAHEHGVRVHATVNTMPRNEEVKFHDEIRDWVSFNTSQLDDKVLMKSDGMPTYHLAVVVDDYLVVPSTDVQRRDNGQIISRNPKFRVCDWGVEDIALVQRCMKVLAPHPLSSEFCYDILHRDTENHGQACLDTGAVGGLLLEFKSVWKAHVLGSV